MSSLHTGETSHTLKKTEYIRARVTPGLKHNAEVIFSALGIDAAEAIRMFYTQVVLHDGLPFDVKIPNMETQKALSDVKNRKGLKKYKNLAAFKKSLE